MSQRTRTIMAWAVVGERAGPFGLFVKRRGASRHLRFANAIGMEGCPYSIVRLTGKVCKGRKR